MVDSSVDLCIEEVDMLFFGIIDEGGFFREFDVVSFFCNCLVFKWKKEMLINYLYFFFVFVKV